MEALGSALVRAPTLKQVSMMFAGGYSSNLFMKSMAAGLAYSRLEELNFLNVINMDASVALIKSLPPATEFYFWSYHGASSARPQW